MKNKLKLIKYLLFLTYVIFIMVIIFLYKIHNTKNIYYKNKENNAIMWLNVDESFYNDSLITN